MGEADVGLPASIAASASGREMAVDGKNLQAAKVTPIESHVRISL
jgi:hypothetical protein